MRFQRVVFVCSSLSSTVTSWSVPSFSILSLRPKYLSGLKHGASGWAYFRATLNRLSGATAHSAEHDAL